MRRREERWNCLPKSCAKPCRRSTARKETTTRQYTSSSLRRIPNGLGLSLKDQSRTANSYFLDSSKGRLRSGDIFCFLNSRPHAGRLVWRSNAISTSSPFLSANCGSGEAKPPKPVRPPKIKTQAKTKEKKTKDDCAKSQNCTDI